MVARLITIKLIQITHTFDYSNLCVWAKVQNSYCCCYSLASYLRDEVAEDAVEVGAT